MMRTSAWMLPKVITPYMFLGLGSCFQVKRKRTVITPCRAAVSYSAATLRLRSLFGSVAGPANLSDSHRVPSVRFGGLDQPSIERWPSAVWMTPIDQLRREDLRKCSELLGCHLGYGVHPYLAKMHKKSGTHIKGSGFFMADE